MFVPYLIILTVIQLVIKVGESKGKRFYVSESAFGSFPFVEGHFQSGDIHRIVDWTDDGQLDGQHDERQ